MTMKTTLLIAVCILLTGNALFAQSAHFITSGVIEFDKNVNMYALINKELAENNDNIFAQKAFDQFKKTHTQIQILKSTLSFGNNKTLFVPAPPPENAGNFFDVPMAQQNNTTYTDVSASTRISQKKVFEETFLVKDSVSKIKWKITDETRDILGYACRRANGLVQDSIYVVAFYTDEIPIVGGPESFTGLPGMILQVALPHESVSWVATKITEAIVPVTTLIPPKKGKAVTGKEFRATLNGAMKDWGIYARSYLKSLQL
ncbi:MAG: hypothetical protein JWQ79_1524 [Mucilaginibacter sp.]|nr:hypothetical protein [Mucilaginibacter sp.]